MLNPESLNVQGEVNQWAIYAIVKWQRELRRKRIGKSGQLDRSFNHRVEGSGPIPSAVSFAFSLHGRFRDMGVGRGLKAFERKSNQANLVGAKAYGANVDYTRRSAKRWFNKIKVSQFYKLAELLPETIGGKVSTSVVDALSAQNTITTRI